MLQTKILREKELANDYQVDIIKRIEMMKTDEKRKKERSERKRMGTTFLEFKTTKKEWMNKTFTNSIMERSQSNSKIIPFSKQRYFCIMDSFC